MTPVDSFLLHCILIDGIGPAANQPLIPILHEHKDRTVEMLYKASKHELRNYGVPSRAVEKLHQGLQNDDLLKNELQILKKQGFCFVSCLDEHYPHLLRAIHQPPLGLLCWGDLSTLQQQYPIACVGARSADAYGRAATTRIVTDLVAGGATIVSGGARGIDAYAHEATLAARGRTIVVLGSGLCKLYPSEHIQLFDYIVKHRGIIVSTFPCTMAAHTGNFPARNRVIAGLSLATIVMQAAHKSGALTTAAYALEQGRDVGAVPGAIDNPYSEGCHALIAQGAFIVTSGLSIFEHIGREYLVREQYIAEHNLEHDSTEQKPESATHVQSPVEQLTSTQERLLSLCRTPQFGDELLAHGLYPNIEQLNEVLWTLSLEGIIEQDFLGRWVMR